MGPNGAVGGPGHGRAHIVGVCDALVLHRTDGGGAQNGALPASGDQHPSSPGDGPLGSGSPLSPVGQGKAVLPLRRGKMGGGQRGSTVDITRVDRGSGQEQALGHGRAGAIEPQSGDAGAPQGVTGAHALIQQVSGEDQIELLPLKGGLFQQQLQGGLLELRLRLLPGLLPIFPVGDHSVKGLAQRPFAFLLADDGGPGGDDGLGGEKNALLASV